MINAHSLLFETLSQALGSEIANTATSYIGVGILLERVYHNTAQKLVESMDDAVIKTTKTYAEMIDYILSGVESI